MTHLLIATRSAHKLREISDLLVDLPEIRLLDLVEAGIPAAAAEDSLEVSPTFEENALAKARYFAARSGLPVLADDSGLCVDALSGAPGVLSKRFSGRSDLSGTDLDLANNEHLLERLVNVPAAERTAHYVCVLAIVSPGGGSRLFRGSVDGIILSAPRGRGGFGYDPLFFVPDLDATFGEVPADVKNRLSHRARAVRAAVPVLRELANSAAPDPARGSPSG